MVTDFCNNNDFQIELSLDNQIQEESKYTYEYVTKENNNFCIYDNFERCEFRITNNNWNLDNYIQVGDSPKFSYEVSPCVINKKNDIILNSPNCQNYKKALRYFDVNTAKKEKESRRFFSEGGHTKKFNLFLDLGNKKNNKNVNENIFKLNIISFNQDKNIIDNSQDKINQCLRCKKTSHLTSECPSLKIKKHKCDQCKLNGHFAEDCLKYPKPIPKYILENSICSFCNLKGHLICQSKEKIQMIDSGEDEVSKDIESSYTGWKDDLLYLNKKQVVNLIVNEENKPIEEEDRVSCPKCKGDHLIKYCPILINTNIGWSSNRIDESYFYIGPSSLMQNKNFYDDDDFSN